MQREEKKILEKEIIKIAEQIIEAAITTCEDKDFQEANIEKAIELVNGLAGKLSLYIDEDNTYIPELLQQIIQQKLPDQRILADLSNFSNTLQKILEEGIKRFQIFSTGNESNTQLVCLNDEIPELTDTSETNLLSEEEECTIKNEPVTNENEIHTLDTEKEQPNEIAADETELYLRKIFPALTLVKNYKIHGIVLNYYFPELKLALEKDAGAGTKSTIWREYHCNKAGIRLYKIGDEELSNFRTFNRFIKKLVSNQ